MNNIPEKLGHVLYILRYRAAKLLNEASRLLKLTQRISITLHNHNAAMQWYTLCTHEKKHGYFYALQWSDLQNIESKKRKVWKSELVYYHTSKPWRP